MERLPEEPSQAEISRGLEETRQVLAGKWLEIVLYLRLMTDPDRIAKTHPPSAYLRHPRTAFLSSAPHCAPHD